MSLVGDPREGPSLPEYLAYEKAQRRVGATSQESNSRAPSSPLSDKETMMYIKKSSLFPIILVVGLLVTLFMLIFPPVPDEWYPVREIKCKFAPCLVFQSKDGFEVHWPRQFYTPRAPLEDVEE